MRPGDVLWRRDLDVLCGILVSTEHLTAALVEIGPGEAARQRAHGGDEVLMVLHGPLWVRAWHDGAVHVFELEAEDVCYLPAGCPHEYRNAGAGLARAICGIARSPRRGTARRATSSTSASARGSATASSRTGARARARAGARSTPARGWSSSGRAGSRARRSGHRSAQETLDDPAAAAIVEDGARRLGAVLATLVNALDPGAVVFGGGLASTPATATARSPPCADVYDDAVRDLPARAAFLGAEGAIAGTALAAARAGQAAGSVASLA